MESQGKFRADFEAGQDEVERLMLYGLAGLQIMLITPAQLAATVRGWCEDPAWRDENASIGEMFRRCGSLTSQQVRLLSTLAEQMFVSREGELSSLLRQLVQATSARDLSQLREELRDVRHAGVQACLGYFEPGAREPSAVILTDAPSGDSLLTHDSRTGEDDTCPLDPTLNNLETATPIKRFEILETIARGGLGTVYRAFDGELHRQVALKKIRADKSHMHSHRRSFLLEAIVTGSLQHPGIPPMYALGVDSGGLPYYAMQLIGGEPLSEHISRVHKERRERTGRLSESELRRLLRIFLDVCEAVDYAHSRNVIHQDLKPANVMLGDFGRTVVLDWGLAKIVPAGRANASSAESSSAELGAPESSASASTVEEGVAGDTEHLTGVGRSITEPILSARMGEASGAHAGDVVGTPAYASPEQLAGAGDEVDRRSDVYGLGAMLYQILTGQPPHEGRTKAEIIALVITGNVQAPRVLSRHIPRGLQAIVMRALQVKPQERYQTVTELRRDLSNWLENQALTVEGEPVSERLQRWARGNRVIVSSMFLGGVMGLLMLASLTILMDQNRRLVSRKNAELRLANEQAVRALWRTQASQRESQRQSDLAIESARFAIQELRGLIGRVPPYGDRRTQLLLGAVPSVLQFAEEFRGKSEGSDNVILVQAEWSDFLLHSVSTIQVSDPELGRLTAASELQPVLEATIELSETARRMAAYAIEHRGRSPMLTLAHDVSSRNRIEALQMLGDWQAAAQASKERLRAIETQFSFDDAIAAADDLVPRISEEFYEAESAYGTLSADVLPPAHPHANVLRLLFAYSQAADALRNHGKFNEACAAAERVDLLHQAYPSLRMLDKLVALSLFRAHEVMATCEHFRGHAVLAEQHYEIASSELTKCIDKFKLRWQHEFEGMGLAASICRGQLQRMDFHAARRTALRLKDHAADAMQRRQWDSRGSIHFAFACAVLAQTTLQIEGDVEAATRYYEVACETHSISTARVKNSGHVRLPRFLSAQQLCLAASLLGHEDDAISFGEEAVAIAEELREAVAGRATGDQVLSRAQAALSAAYLNAGRTEQAFERMSGAMQSARRFMRRMPASDFLFRRAAENAIQMSEVLTAQGDYERALMWLRDGRDLNQRLLEEHGADGPPDAEGSLTPAEFSSHLSEHIRDWKNDAQAQRQFALIYRQQGLLEDAIAAQQATIESTQRMIRGSSAGLLIEHDLHVLLCELAELQLAGKRAGEALETAEIARVGALMLVEQSKLVERSEVTLNRVKALVGEAQTSIMKDEVD